MLTEEMANFWMARKPNNPMRRGDWHARVGTVARRSERGHQVSVLWDGNKSFDIWPPKALRLIERCDVIPKSRNW
jgi:hypothetical protein